MPHKDPETRRQYEQARYATRKREGTLRRSERPSVGRPTVPAEQQRTERVTINLTPVRKAELLALLERLNEGGRFRTYGRMRDGADGSRLSTSDALNDALEDWMRRTGDLYFMTERPEF